MTQPVAAGRAGGWGSGIEPAGAAPAAPDTDALHRRENDLDCPLPLPPLPRAAVAAAAMTPAARDAQVQAGLDAFRLSMTAPYRTPEGAAWPGTPFQMSARYGGQVASIQANRAVLAKAVAHAHLTPVESQLVQIGRGSPESLHAVTQALIDDGQMPPAAAGVDAAARIRQMMFDCGIGIDCAGYVQLAYVRAMRVSVSAAGFGPRADESLADLGSRGFTRVGDLAQVRPGDVVVLGPPSKQPGHRAIVYAQHLATGDDLAELRGRGGAARAFAGAPPIRVFQVDSSWGSSGDAQYGGVRRESWWYSESTKQWGWLAQGDGETRAFSTSSTPINHPFDRPYGIYRGSVR